MPAMVKVFAEASTEATDPRNAVARGAFAVDEVDDAVAAVGKPLPEGEGDGEASFFGALKAVVRRISFQPV